MRYCIVICIFTLYSSASVQNPPDSSSTFNMVRGPAEEAVTNKSCSEIMANLVLSPTYNDDLTLALKNKKLITFKEKLMQIEFPRLEWINRVKKSFNLTMQQWNNKLYPTFYLSNEEQVIPIAKSYASAIDKETNNLLDDEATNTLKMVRAWSDSYQNYTKELNQLIDERIALQYNLSLIKKLNLKNQTRDIQLNLMKDGVLTPQVFALHAEDNSYRTLIGNLQSQINLLDDGWIRNGKIKDRIVRQALLQDMLTIVQRELEHSVKNTDKAPAEAIKELDRLTTMMKNSDYTPSTFGVFKITDKVFINELMALSKTDVIYQKFEDPLGKLSNILSNFLDGSPSDQEKVGIFSRIYASITSLTPLQMTTRASIAAVAGFGTYRYFWFDQSSVTELGSNDPHQVQINKTKKVTADKNAAHTSVIEVQVDNEIKN